MQGIFIGTVKQRGKMDKEFGRQAHYPDLHYTFEVPFYMEAYEEASVVVDATYYAVQLDGGVIYCNTFKEALEIFHDSISKYQQVRLIEITPVLASARELHCWFNPFFDNEEEQ
jgi:hypothetical protein